MQGTGARKTDSQPQITGWYRRTLMMLSVWRTGHWYPLAVYLLLYLSLKQYCLWFVPYSFYSSLNTQCRRTHSGRWASRNLNFTAEEYDSATEGSWPWVLSLPRIRNLTKSSHVRVYNEARLKPFDYDYPMS